EDIGAKTEHEVRNLRFARGYDGIGERVGGIGLEEEIGGAADLEGGVGRQRLVPLQARAGERGGDALERSRIERRGASRGRLRGELGHGPEKEIMSVVPSPPRMSRRRMPLITALLLALVAWWPLSAQRAELERR